MTQKRSEDKRDPHINQDGLTGADLRTQTHSTSRGMTEQVWTSRSHLQTDTRSELRFLRYGFNTELKQTKDGNASSNRPCNNKGYT